MKKMPENGGEGASENVIEKLHIVKTAKLAGIIPMIIRYSLFFYDKEYFYGDLIQRSIDIKIYPTFREIFY